ncbi:MAG: cupin domain-containing protein [Planctomycetes bacterium]|nr:cupin domain-containing protein [Planctomycetota bacterium]
MRAASIRSLVVDCTPPARPFLADPRPEAQFHPAKMGKATLFRGAGLLVGLNAFEPGQAHASHAHAGTDKLYVVLDGEGEFEVAGEQRRLGPGGQVFAAAGVAHGVRNVGSGRLLVLAVMGPPPGAG